MASPGGVWRGKMKMSRAKMGVQRETMSFFVLVRASPAMARDPRKHPAEPGRREGGERRNPATIPPQARPGTSIQGCSRPLMNAGNDPSAITYSLLSPINKILVWRGEGV